MLGQGEYAFDQAQLVTVAQLNPLHVEAFVPLSLYQKIRAGMVAEIYPEQPIGGRYQAKVTIVDHVFDAASGTIGVRLELPNPEHKLPAGLKCQAHFAVEG
jgi:multidrug efflux pump subunit AcrA (membrane-fusion protein)